MILINGVRFLNLLKYGFKYDEELNRLHNKPLSPGTTKYVPKLRMVSPNSRSMIIGGLAYYEMLWDNYKQRGDKWMKMSKEEAIGYDNDSIISTIFADEQYSSSDDNYADDIDEYECDEYGHTIFPSGSDII